MAPIQVAPMIVAVLLHAAPYALAQSPEREAIDRMAEEYDEYFETGGPDQSPTALDWTLLWAITAATAAQAERDAAYQNALASYEAVADHALPEGMSPNVASQNLTWIVMDTSATGLSPVEAARALRHSIPTLQVFRDASGNRHVTLNAVPTSRADDGMRKGEAALQKAERILPGIVAAGLRTHPGSTDWQRVYATPTVLLREARAAQSAEDNRTATALADFIEAYSGQWRGKALTIKGSGSHRQTGTYEGRYQIFVQNAEILVSEVISRAVTYDGKPGQVYESLTCRHTYQLDRSTLFYFEDGKQRFAFQEQDKTRGCRHGSMLTLRPTADGNLKAESKGITFEPQAFNLRRVAD